MRPRHRATGVPALVLSPLVALLAGCSSGGSDEVFATSSLRPREGMVRDEPRRYPDGSTSGGTYGRPYAEAPRRRYVDPGEPTPREMAYDGGYGSPRGIETASIGSGARTYGPDARWQQPASGITTGSVGPSGDREPYRPNPPHVVEVREGDTLYSLSRRFNVPVGDLMAANRLPSERIAIGQRLVIPTRYR
jgi:hypothetical protein